jgi:hypothetical protein
LSIFFHSDLHLPHHTQLSDEILVRLLVTSVMLGNRDNGDSAEDMSHPTDPALEWFSFLFRHLFQAGTLSRILLICGSNEWKLRRADTRGGAYVESTSEQSKPIESFEDSSMVITADQLILLNILLFELGELV